MLFIINLTGLKKTYWLPSFSKDSCRESGIWCVDIKFLWVQITIYNKKMGVALVRAVNDEKTWRK
jgi:hypothetical protein